MTNLADKQNDQMLSALLTATMQALEVLKDVQAQQSVMKAEITKLQENTIDKTTVDSVVKDAVANDATLELIKNKVLMTESSMDTLADAMGTVLQTAPNQEVLIDTIQTAFNNSSRDYSVPLKKVADGFETNQANLKTLASYVDSLLKNDNQVVEAVQNMNEAIVENSTRLKSMDIRMSTLAKEQIAPDQSIDSALDILRQYQK